MLPISRRSKRYFLCFSLCLLAFGQSASLLRAFLIPIHRNVTNDALDRFSQIQNWERKQMAKGCAAVDMLEGGIPFFGGPYEKRFHFDNDFDFRQVAANFVD